MMPMMMDQMNEYKHATAVLTQLEQQLATHTEEYLDKAYEEITTEIEDKFTQCFVALACRKESLLREVGRSFQSKKAQLKDNQSQVATAIAACKEILKSGSVLYNTNRCAAAQLWKTATCATIPVPNVDDEYIKKVPSALLLAIEQTVAATSARPRSLSVDASVTYSRSESELPSKKAKFREDRAPSEDICCTNPMHLARSNPIHFSPDVLSSSSPTIGSTSQKKSIQQLIKPPAVETATLIATSGVPIELPRGVIIHPIDKHIYFCDSGDFSIKRISPSGEVSIFAAKTGLELKRPFGLAFDRNSNSFYVTNLGSHVISKISPAGEISVFAGCNSSGSKDGFGMLARFNSPHGIAVDQSTGCVYVSDCDSHSIRKISTEGHVSTFAGSGKEGYLDAFGKSAQFNKPWGIFFDEEEQVLLVCDAINNKLRKISLNGKVTTMCSIDSPSCVTMTKERIILVTSFMASTISKVLPLGNGKYEAIPLTGKAKGDERGKDVKVEAPYGIVFDEETNTCIVSEFFNPRIRRVFFPL